MEQLPHGEKKQEAMPEPGPSLRQTVKKTLRQAKESMGFSKFGATDLKQADLSDSNLAEEDFSYSALMDTVFDRSDLSKATFRAAALKGASFRSANVSGATFATSDLQSVTFSGADLTGHASGVLGAVGTTRGHRERTALRASRRGDARAVAVDEGVPVAAPALDRIDLVAVVLGVRNHTFTRWTGFAFGRVLGFGGGWVSLLYATASKNQSRQCQSVDPSVRRQG